MCDPGQEHWQTHAPCFPVSSKCLLWCQAEDIISYWGRPVGERSIVCIQDLSWPQQEERLQRSLYNASWESQPESLRS